MITRPSSFAFRAALAFAVSSGVAQLACSDAPKRPAAAVDGTASPPLPVGAGSGDGGTGTLVDASDAGEAGACNDVELTGLLVDRVALAGDPPVATGGTIVDGLYDLTDDTVYVGTGVGVGPTGITVRATMRISGGMVDDVVETGGTSALQLVRTSSVVSVMGANFVATELCPLPGGSTLRQFTSPGTTLLLTDPVANEAFTFTMR